ncbi:MAG: RHS repeat-associated core domain-containing protein, partial [Nitrospirota bacterium]
MTEEGAKKAGPSGTTYYIGDHFEVTNGEQIKYVFAGNLRIAKVSPSYTYYFHKDHLGSSSAMTDYLGNIVEATNYMPFGEQREHTGTNISNYKFTDQELDPETGLYYYGARYYDAVTGRFISPDSIVQDPFDP